MNVLIYLVYFKKYLQNHTTIRLENYIKHVLENSGYNVLRIYDMKKNDRTCDYYAGLLYSSGSDVFVFEYLFHGVRYKYIGSSNDFDKYIRECHESKSLMGRRLKKVRSIIIDNVECKRDVMEYFPPMYVRSDYLKLENIYSNKQRVMITLKQGYDTITKTYDWNDCKSVHLFDLFDVKK
jgi:hypothetical protein